MAIKKMFNLFLKIKYIYVCVYIYIDTQMEYTFISAEESKGK